MVILDAGTGIRLLGNELTHRAIGELEVDLFLSHTHWDHIQGLPFFAPFFGAGNTVRIWGPRQGEVALEAILRRQMDPVVFPVPLDELAAELQVRHVEPETVGIDGFELRTARLRHPGQTLGYRLVPEDGGTELAYVTDNELGSGGDYEVGASWREDIGRFLGGVDVLIHDSMYTPEELDRHRGWGHSSYAEAVGLADDVGAKQLILFHHAPEHDDDEMDKLVDEAQALASAAGNGLHVLAADESLELVL